jgi:Rieske Fe-S protein
MGGAALLEIAFLCFSFLIPSHRKNDKKSLSSIVEAGKAESFEPGSVTPFVRGQFYLVCLKDGGFLALSSQCTHLGCSVPWDNEQGLFVCPCHASKFNITGEVVTAPAPRAMDIFDLQIKNNTVLVDISRKIKRAQFSKSHVVYPDVVKKTGQKKNG